MKTKILSLVIIATFIISSAAMAQSGNNGQQWNANRQNQRAMMKRQAMQKGERQNFFTEEQKEAMKKLRLESAKEIKPLKNELRELQAKQQTLTTADNADLKAINKNIDKMSDVKAGIAKIMAKKQQEIRSMLTDEQLIKFDSRKNRMNQNHGRSFSIERMKRSGEHRFGSGA